MQENETQWANLSLYERPPETAIVCGFITDKETTDPSGDGKCESVLARK